MTDSNRPVALITGSATGVGRACAVEFAKRDFNVIVNYSQSRAEAEETVAAVESFDAEALLCQCDVSDDGLVNKMLQQVSDKYGRLDVLVNNAGTTSFIEHRDLESLTEEIWDRILAVNLKGAFFVTRAAVDMLRKAPDGGTVVNVSSVAGLTGRGSSVAYAASKGGLNTMTKSLALALAPEIRVNAVCPGPIDSRWIRQGNPNWNLEEMVSDYPLPRASLPEDIADAIVFLALDTPMVTGHLLTIDGGQTL